MLLTNEEINKMLDEALEDEKKPNWFLRWGSVILFFIIGAIVGTIVGLTTVGSIQKELSPEPVWRYENQPYSQQADGSVIYHHGYTQGVTDNPISDKPYSVGADGKVIFYHGK